MVYGISEKIQKEDMTIKMEGIGPDGNKLEYSMKLPISEAKKGNLIHKLAARQILQDLQDNKSYVTTTDRIRAETINLGI